MTVENTNANTVNARPSREGVPLGNRFVDLPVIAPQEYDTSEVLTLKDAAALAQRSTLTVTRYLRSADVQAVALRATGSVGRPAPVYARSQVEVALGLTSPRDAADAVLADAQDALDMRMGEVAGSIEE